MHSSYSSDRAQGSSRRAQSLELDLPLFRKRAGVSLEQIAQSTKIGSRFLKAIEGEQFEQLPGGIFSTSYLRQYAEAIGYDEHALVAHYNHKMNPSEPISKGPQTETGGRGLLDRWLRTAAQAPR
jgi:cytoskeletal protein RodZ